MFGKKSKNYTIDTHKLQALMSQNPHKQIIQLRAQIWEANQAYFNENREIVPESVRDQMKQKLIELEKAHPELITPDSPTQRVGMSLDGKLPKITHRTPKFSLADGFNPEDLIEFDTRVKRFLKAEEIQYSCELKLDGLNITCWYEKGVLVKAITRGDGKIGEDVTHSIRTCENLPLTLSQPLDLEISGEVFIAKRHFQQINQELSEDQRFANARNLAAGSVRQLDPQIASQRNLQIFFYELSKIEGGSISPKNQKEAFAFFDQLGLPHEPDFEIFETIEEVVSFCQKLSNNQTKRQNFFYDIDGIVIKVHDFALRKRLGYTAKTAKFAIAWKFPATQKYTQLLDVHYQVGRTGALTPVAILEPLEIDGSTVSRASLHNPEEIARKGIKIGDQVIVQKAGDIIPEIIGPVKGLQEGPRKEIIYPQVCPECQSAIDFEETIPRCHNAVCPARQRQNLFYFADILKIDGLGPRSIEALLELEYIKIPADFWRLKSLDLATLPGFKAKKIDNLLQALDRRKSLTLDEIFTGLGIRLVGSENSKILAQYLRDQYGEITLATWNEILKRNDDVITLSSLAQIEGIGEKVAQSFADFCTSLLGQKHFEAFLEVGIELLWVAQNQKNQKFKGHKYVITGSFEAFSRDELKRLITDQGGKIQSSVSAQTDVLLAGSAPGSKLKKAQELDIEVWDEVRIAKELTLESKAPSTLF